MTRDKPLPWHVWFWRCSFEWWSYTLKCTRSFLNISQFSLNNKQIKMQSASYLYLNSRKTLHAFVVMFSVYYVKAVVVAMQTAAIGLSNPPHADRLLWPRIFAVKRQKPPPVPFFLPSAFISHFSAGACGAAFSSYRDSLPVCLRNKLYSHIYFLRHTAPSVFSCRVLYSLTQLALV